MLPFLVEELGAQDSYASLQAWFGILQVIGGLLTGPLMDYVGVKPLLILNFAASAACYFGYATVDSVFMLGVWQLPTLLQHGMMASRTYLSIRAPSTEARAKLGG